MGLRKRIDDFCGTDTEYIDYLESKICQLTATESPPSPVRSVVPEDAINDCDSDEHPTPSITFIEYDPHIDRLDHRSQSQAPKRQRIQPRWEREMDEMLRDFPDAGNWASKREEVGLTSSDNILKALDILIHGKESQAEAAPIEANSSIISADRVSQLLNNFAVSTAALQIDQAFTTQIYHFRMFIFVSLCCVALDQRVDGDLVEEVMAKCVSGSSAKNLSKLRSGAFWVNKMMSRLAAQGLGHRAYELFILCEFRESTNIKTLKCGDQLAGRSLSTAVLRMRKMQIPISWRVFQTAIQELRYKPPCLFGFPSLSRP